MGSFLLYKNILERGVDMDETIRKCKDRFMEIYKSSVSREGASDFLEWLEGTDFFVAPASTRFHGNHEGGLLQHSLNVYDCLNEEVANAGLQEVYSAETIAIASLLHDICKVNFYKKGFRNAKDEESGQWYKKEVYEIDEKFPCGEHADKSIIIIQNFIHLEPEEIPFSPENLAKLIRLTEAQVINSTVAKEVFEEMFRHDIDPEAYVEEKGLKTVHDEEALRSCVTQLIAENPQSVADYQGGKKAALGFLVGQIMKASKGKADAGKVNAKLREKLD